MTAFADYPPYHPRRLRKADWIRRLVRESTLTPADLIWPIIVHDGSEPRVPVASMPGVDRLRVVEAVNDPMLARDRGIPMLAVFPHIDPAKKDSMGSQALDPGGLIPTVVRAIKDAVPEV